MNRLANKNFDTNEQKSEYDGGRGAMIIPYEIKFA